MKKDTPDGHVSGIPLGAYLDHSLNMPKDMLGHALGICLEAHLRQPGACLTVVRTCVSLMAATVALLLTDQDCLLHGHVQISCSQRMHGSAI